jgi:predicted acylesterase/phospholipase RssA
METVSPLLQECDIIMKGGITSGVVYPTAVFELARTYRFRNIGGTSAGAMAAAVTAAAEVGRAVPGGGFDRLAELPGILQEKLATLFQPSPQTLPAFRALLAFLGSKGSTKKKFARAALTGLATQPAGLLLGALGGLAVFVLLVVLGSRNFDLNVWGWMVGLLFALLGGIAGAAVTLVRGTLRGLEDNFFGFCNGLDQNGADLPLTPWLAGVINGAAGRAPADLPLTFGDLWQARTAEEREKMEEDPSLRAVNLEVMTTNVTNGVPMRLPFASRDFFFDPAELRRFFPPEIVAGMEASPPKLREKGDQKLIDLVTGQTRFRPLPAPADLPVVVAARMSLSFPVLLSAVPLYRIDWSRKANQEAKKAGRAPALERCWFSDGGIGSNFPVHFFDGLLPSRPTFGINLRPFHPDFPKDEHDESKNVRFPVSAGQEIAPTYTAIPNLFAFLGTIVRTMQNWVDNTQMRLPGYRDRVAHVNLTDKEGGLNLIMPPEVIEALTQRGEAAGKMLRDEFNWDRHRWIRYRTAMQQLQGKLEGMAQVYQGGFESFLAGYDSDAEKSSFRKDLSWKERAREKTGNLLKAVQSWRPQNFSDDAPGPAPDLRIGPKR